MAKPLRHDAVLRVYVRRYRPMQLAQKHLHLFVRCLRVAVAMISVALLLLFTGTVQAAPGVTIPDENLRVALEVALGKSAGEPIAEFELVHLTQLVFSNKSITNLTGLELCSNLERLELARNSISDISALASLTNLEVLFIAGNQITDISALTSLTSLQSLYLNDATISDISALASLNNLEVLYLYTNSISDISALASLTNLTTAALKDNELNSAAYAVHIPALQAKGVSVRYDEQKPWDVTRDGIVNIFDLILVAAHYGE